MLCYHIVLVLVQELIRLICYLGNKEGKWSYSGKNMNTERQEKSRVIVWNMFFSQTRVGNTYISSIMLNCKCSTRKLGFGKSFVVLELFVQLLRQCLVCGLWKHADGCISAQKKVTVVRRMYSQNWCKNKNPWLICETTNLEMDTGCSIQ